MSPGPLILLLLAQAAFAAGRASLISGAEQERLGRLGQAYRYKELKAELGKIEAARRKAKKLPPAYESLTRSLIAAQGSVDLGPDGSTQAFLLREIGDLYLQLGAPLRAQAFYEEGLKGQPSTAVRAQLTHGFASALIQDREELSSYRRALELFNEASMLEHFSAELRALSLHGACFSGWHVWLYDGRRDETAWGDAIVACSEALRLRPSAELASAINLTIGCMHGDRRDDKQERLYYREAVLTDPGSVMARFNLGRAYLRAGDREKAAAEQRALIALDPERAEKLKDELAGAGRR